MFTLQDRLNELRKHSNPELRPYTAPREVIETMDRATAELKASGIEARALKVGDRAPSFVLFNEDHEQMSSSELLRQGPLERPKGMR